MAEPIRDGLRLEAIAADIADDGHAALELLATDDYDIAVLDRRRARRQQATGATRSPVCAWTRSAAR